MALAALYTVVAIIKPVLTPHPPAPVCVPAQRETLDMHRLVQKLKVIPLTGPAHVLHGKLANANRSKEIQAQATEGKQDEQFTQR